MDESIAQQKWQEALAGLLGNALGHTRDKPKGKKTLKNYGLQEIPRYLRCNFEIDQQGLQSGFVELLLPRSLHERFAPATARLQ